MSLSSIINDMKSALPVAEAVIPVVEELAPALGLSDKLSKIESIVKPILATGIVSDVENVWAALSAAIQAHGATPAAAAIKAAT